ncbi:uncharacterized protein LOC118207488 [Anguilla anguilla]|uniref:uncharacterized protein LOC118207488 n=1 Tax=Anguilla anguilla TaxID=7936 RepID=UPI0015A9F146|nr:uncharacterized protein LOC118207488 [Anguilla anguilla]
MIQHDPVSPQCSGLSGPESRNGSEQFPLTEPDRFNIAEESSPDQKKMLQNKPTLQMNSPEDGKAVCKLSNVLLETSSSAEAPQCNQPFVRGMSGSQDSRNQNIPEHTQEVTHGQSLLTFSQEKNMNTIGSPEISPPKEFIQMPNTANLPVPTGISPSLNNIGGHGPSWCDELYPVDVQCPNSDEEESPPEYQEVEEFNNVPINVSNETTSQCQAKTEIGNIGPKTSCAASENHKPSVVTGDKALPFQTPKLIDTQIPVQSDLVPAPAPPGTYNAANGLGINLTKSSVASDGSGSSVKSIALPDSNSDKASKADDWLQEKGENLPRTSTVECVKSPQQASIDISAVNEVETVLGPELQNKQSVDKPVLHTLEAKVNSSAECEPSLPLELTASAKPLATKEPNKPLDTKRPVHSMSAFWKEMEKLTINDILYLRSSSNAPRVLPRDSAPRDTSDAGDSGNSSHLEDSRLDRSCVDMSTIPEFEEERSLSHSASVKSSLDPKEAKKPGQRSLGSCNSRGVLWESELHPVGPGMDDGTHETPTLYPGDTITPPFLSDKAHQGLRRMCKNVSVQNLRALEAEPRVTSASLVTTTTTTEEEVLRESSGTFQRPKEKCTSVPLESRSARKSSVESSLPGDGATTGGYGMPFREIFGYFFGASEAGVGQADTSHTEAPAGDGGSVPETYDHFFSEFETGNFFFPLIRGTGGEQTESVAVISYTSSSDRNLQFPEAYDYFFPDSSSSDSDDKEDSDDDQGPIRVVTRFDKGAGEPPVDTAEAPDMYEHFFASSDWGESLFWRNPLSLRRMRFTGTTGSNEGPASRVLVTVVQMGRSVVSTIFTDGAGDFHGAVSPQRPLYCLEEQIFRELEEQQRRYTDLQTAVAVPMTTDTPLLPLRQSDMCLICISFASWVLKTANPHDSDTWKAALLANISALSAIRYLRRYVRDAGKEA